MYFSNGDVVSRRWRWIWSANPALTYPKKLRFSGAPVYGRGYHPSRLRRFRQRKRKAEN